MNGSFLSFLHHIVANNADGYLLTFVFCEMLSLLVRAMTGRRVNFGGDGVKTVFSSSERSN